MMDTVCKRCMLQTAGKRWELLTEYLKQIPEKDCAPINLYKQRLTICEHCKNGHNGMCIYCADFVEIRAAKRENICPAPQAKW